MTNRSRALTVGAAQRAGLIISAAIFAVFAFSAAFAYADATCSTVGGTLLVDHTMQVANDPDSSVSGPNWALDTFSRHIQIWQEPSAPVGEYCAKADDSGSFTTNGTISPQNGSQILSHITGNFSGGTYGKITGGTFSTSTDPSDVDCSADPATCSAGLTKYWTDTYFGGGETYDYGSNWGWTYTTTSNGTWVNAAAGNTGDIYPVYDTTTSTGYGSLSAAITAANPGDVIQMESDASTTAKITVSKALTIDGNGHTLYAPIDNSANSNSNNTAIGIDGVAGAVIIENLTIDGSGSTKTHGINVYESGNVTLSSVTSKNNSKAGMVVNGSTVTATDFNTSGNSWGGVNVDPGSGVTTPSSFSLSSGTISEGTQIWSDGDHVNATSTVAVNASGYTQYHVAGTTAGYVWSTTTPKGATIQGDPTNTLYSTISAAITAAVDGNVINVGPGTYSENLALNKGVSIVGASGVTINPAADQPIITLTGSGASNASPLTLQNLTLHTDATGSDLGKMTAIYIPNTASVSHVKFDHLTVTGNNHTYPGLESGVYIEMKANVSDLTVSNSSFSDLSYGFISNADATTPGSLDTVVISDTVFNHNSSKGMYVEKLSNATFSNVQFTNNGSDPALMASWAQANGAGLDINLKYNSYPSITMSNVTATGNGLGAKEGAGVMVKARDDGSYATKPATLAGFTLNGGEITGNERGLRVGEPNKTTSSVSNIAINSITFGTNTKTYAGVDGSAYGSLVNWTNGSVDATKNYWGSAAEPSTTTDITGSGNANVTYIPWYADAAMTKLGYPVNTSGGAASTTITSDESISNAAGTVTAEIPAGTVISGDSTWDGTISAPTTTSVTLGSDKTVGIAIEVGAAGHNLTFDKAVKLTFVGQAGKTVGFYNAAGTFATIDGECPTPIASIDSLLPVGSACKTTDSGDLIVYTKHFSTFVTFTTNTTTTGGGGGGSSGGGGGGGGGGGAPAGSITSVGAPQLGGSATVTTGNTGSTGSTGGQVLGAATYNFRANLTVGSKGADVEALQQILVDAGFLDGKLPRGYFGALTKQAVMKWQKANGITPASGYVGALTRTKLNAGATPTSSDEQKSLLIQSLTLQLNDLMARLNALMAGTSTATSTH